MEGSYIVVFKDVVNSSQQQVIRSGLVASHPSHTITAEYTIVPGFAAKLTVEGVDYLRSLPEVDYVQEDGITKLEQIVSQENLQAPVQEGIKLNQTACREDLRPPWNLARVGSRQCGIPLRDSFIYPDRPMRGTYVFVLDSGIRITHREFNGRAVHGYNVFPGQPDTDEYGFGTHQAAIIGGITYGIARQVTLSSVKVFDRFGEGTFSGLISGIDYVGRTSKPNTDVAVIGGVGAFNQAATDAINRLSGTVFVTGAAGNSRANGCSYTPCNSNAFCVACLDRPFPQYPNEDVMCSTSNYGQCVDIFAPGMSILSAWYRDDSDFMTVNAGQEGHVAGIAALILSERQQNPQDVKTIIRREASGSCIRNPLPPTGTPNLVAFASFQCRIQ